ncbi:DUF3298 and DUF4163 domain-containing protein [Aurantibacter crassamenti]|uniref:DUF3298 and DUF4163 domain-containing protein n=1 Tax=Aurantibacter crassamenti TaxID=1837375 RepID=UPI00193A9DB1|nr:DUF3298 and DUF4163 domain-containing protein [Aurantibacter crassamenti]MBM1104917.1 DUF3298 and DUF4163 domain-containing protein [Aurantibacter crassamenti]
MKNSLNFLLLLVLFIGCKNANELTLTTASYTNESCANCPNIKIKIPQVVNESRLAENINSNISKEISSILLFDESEDLENFTIEESIKAFNESHAEITKLYPDEADIWEAEITGSVSYEDKNTLTIVLNSYLFSGGAHGYTSIQYLNFNKKTGKELKTWQIFKNKDAFKTYAESAFRKAEGIPLDAPINSTGFMFEQDSFNLPENIGFTNEGIRLQYNQYEVASYADGPIEITLPYNEAQKYLKGRFKTDKRITTTSFED